MQISIESERLRKKFSESLKVLNGQMEENRNRIFNQQMREEIFDQQTSYMQDQFMKLYESVHHITQKTIQKQELELKTLRREQSEMKVQCVEQRVAISYLQTERDTFRDETRELNLIKTDLQREMMQTKLLARQKFLKLEDKVKSLHEDLERCAETLDKKSKVVQQLMDEREKQKTRIQRLLKKKGNFNSGIKTCKNCNMDYNEKENFNWSCRVHQSEWGGEMWWCCGKTRIDQPGCKFSKHESKDDEEDSDDPFGAKNDEKQKNLKCTCCKELGHSIEECTRDPNLKTSQPAVCDQERINRIKDFRKLHADTIVNTTHLIKKAVMVPLQTDDEGREVEQANAEHPFMRGIMTFDDFNYNHFNKFVLVPAPATHKEKQLLKQQTLKQIEDKQAPLNQQNLTRHSEAPYAHEATSLRADHEQVPAAQHTLDSQLSDANCLENKSESSASESVNSKKSVQEEEPAKKSEKQETQHSTIGDTEYKYKIFYNDAEIEATKNAQLADAFENLHGMREGMKRETHHHSRINIHDFAPRLELVEPESNKKLKRKRVALEEPSMPLLSPEPLEDQHSGEDISEMKHDESIDQIPEDRFLKQLELEELNTEIRHLVDERIKDSPKFSKHQQLLQRSVSQIARQGTAKQTN